jgi:hypothetical protein
MKCAVELASGGIYIPSFINIGSGVPKLFGGGRYRHTQSARCSHKSTFIFLNKQSRLKIGYAKKLIAKGLVSYTIGLVIK